MSKDLGTNNRTKPLSRRSVMREQTTRKSMSLIAVLVAAPAILGLLGLTGTAYGCDCLNLESSKCCDNCR
jgi:hypothetical protein